jgi:3-mercaptopyruvate sulfurtransferase SseA
MDHGFVRVRPLHGGLDAWIAAGYPVELLNVEGTAVAGVSAAGVQSTAL